MPVITDFGPDNHGYSPTTRVANAYNTCGQRIRVRPTPTIRVANVYVGVAAAVGTEEAAAVGADVRQ